MMKRLLIMLMLIKKIKERKIILNLLQTYLFSILLYKAQNSRQKSEELTELVEAIYSQFVYIPKIPKTVGKLFPTINQIKKFSRRRREVLKMFQDTLGKDHFPKVEKETSVTPYFIPYFNSVDKLNEIQKVLSGKNIDLPIYHFDKNRNMLSPKYVKSLIIPAHQTIKWEIFEEIIETIKEVNKD